MKKIVVAASLAAVLCLVVLGSLKFGFSRLPRDGADGDSSSLRERSETPEESVATASPTDDVRMQETDHPSNRAEPSGAAQTACGQLSGRLQAVEKELKELRTTLEDFVPAEGAVRADFTTPDGFTEADKYFEEGKFATAASGYLAFLDHNPDRTDAVEILKKAREAYKKAGYGTKAIELQKKILDNYPLDDRSRELMALANLENEEKRYKDAINHVEEAAEATTSLEERLWALAYRAWYIELDQGPEAGLRAYQEAEEVAIALGLGESGPVKRYHEKMERLQRIIASTRGSR